MPKTARIALSETLLAKILPLAIVIPLWLRMQNYFPDFRITFDVEQGAYVLAIAIIAIVSFIEFRISQAGLHGWDSFNLGVGLSLVIAIVGTILLGFIIITGYHNFTGSSQFNDIVSFYMGVAILVIAIQGTREIMLFKKELKNKGY